ncbi:MAG: hypothetical protein WKG07_37655 [Hymenobacter sp.]
MKRNKFGGLKYVYDLPTMKELKTWFYTEWQRRFPARAGAVLDVGVVTTHKAPPRDNSRGGALCVAV